MRLLASIAAVAALSGAAGAQEFGAFSMEDLRQGALAMPTVAAAAVPLAPDVGRYAVRGIDVSAYQDTIDWKKVAGAGVAFAFIKATESVSYDDDAFARNWAGAKAAGVPRGAYHFYDFCQKGAAQAAHFIAAVPKDADALPEVVDLEKSRDCRTMPSKAAFTKQFAVFVAALKKHYGRAPIVYTNGKIYADYLADAGADYQLWIADPNDASPDVPAGRSWTFWQHSWNGRVAGIDDLVDLDVFNGTPQQLASLSAALPGVMVAER